MNLPASIDSVVEAVAAAVFEAENVRQVQAGVRISEGIHQFPTIQVYPELFAPSTTRTNKVTFGGTVYEEITVNVDIYARQRSEIGLDMQAVTKVADAVRVVVYREEKAPYFGHAGIHSFTWNGQRVTLVYGDPEQRYVGLRFVLKIYVSSTEE